MGLEHAEQSGLEIPETWQRIEIINVPALVGRDYEILLGLGDFLGGHATTRHGTPISKIEIHRDDSMVPYPDWQVTFKEWLKQTEEQCGHTCEVLVF